MNFDLRLGENLQQFQEMALKIHFPFWTTHLCKALFSALTTIKSKY